MLDEPTNDLDVETLRALEEALLEFPGTALVISHDRWFLDRVATHILAYEGECKVVFFEGNYPEYEAIQMQTIISLVSGGLGLPLVLASLKHLARTGVRYLDLPAGDTPLLETDILWNTRRVTPAFANLLAIASKEALEEDARGRGQQAVGPQAVDLPERHQ